MDSIANRILKARQYAEEKDQRIHVNSFEVVLHGEHDEHTVTYERGIWHCTCEEFTLRNICAHVMAMEEIMGDAVETAVIRVG
ncbi:MAG: SWIM zinc finger family protein [Chloroflexota bacterium]